MVRRNSAPLAFAYIWRSKWVGIIAIKTETTQIHFWSDVFAAVLSSYRKVPKAPSVSLRNAPLHYRNVAWRQREKMAVQETKRTLANSSILWIHFRVLKVFEKVKRWQVRLFEAEFAESWILLAQSILRPWNSSCGTCFTRWFGSF